MARPERIPRAAGPGRIEWSIMHGLAIRIVLLTLLAVWRPAAAQDLEPRRWSHLPTGLNVFGVTAGASDLDIYFDPVLRIEDAEARLYLGGLGFVRAFGLFGQSARFDLKVPYAAGRWAGLLDGESASVRRRGFLDPRLRFSLNLFGAPALAGGEYLAFRQQHPVNTTVGVALEVTLPAGDYNDTKLINLGNNRWVARPQLGILHQRGPWQFELTGSVFIYGENDAFWNGNRLTQDPLYFAQGHVVYAFRPGWWCSLSGGYAFGAEKEVNAIPKNDDWRSVYGSVSLGMPLGQRQALKLAWVWGGTNVSTGSDSRNVILGWTVNWDG